MLPFKKKSVNCGRSINKTQLFDTEINSFLQNCFGYFNFGVFTGVFFNVCKVELKFVIISGVLWCSVWIFLLFLCFV